MLALPKFAPSRMTVAEFLDWPGDGSGAHFELVDGEPRAMAPASVTHGIIQANITALLHSHLRGTGCKAIAAPGVVPLIRSSANMRIPDLAVNCTPDERGQHSLPDPIVIIEILSPSNEAETRENIWAYTTIPSVREILLVRSTSVAAERLVRQDDGGWPAEPQILTEDDRVLLLSIDFDETLRQFYADTHLARGNAT